jgi:hypothetical protein
MTTIAELITAHADHGHTITPAAAFAHLAQREAETQGMDDYLTTGHYDWQATRPYAEQILCGCGKQFALWAIEQMVDDKPDRILYCEQCAENTERACAAAGEPVEFLQLFTVEQATRLAELEFAGVGAN